MKVINESEFVNEVREGLVLIDFLRCDAHSELWLKGLECCIEKEL